MIDTWIVLGFIGWIALMIYRVIESGYPKSDKAGFVLGFLFSIVLGPLSIAFLGYLLYRRYCDQTTNQ